MRARQELQLQPKFYSKKKKKTNNFGGSVSCWKPGPNTHLGSRGQQELDTLRLAPQARLVQGGDGVVGDGVDAGAALYQLLELQNLSPPGCLVNRRPIGPKTCRGGKKGILKTEVKRKRVSERERGSPAGTRSWFLAVLHAETFIRVQKGQRGAEA